MLASHALDNHLQKISRNAAWRGRRLVWTPGNGNIGKQGR